MTLQEWLGSREPAPPPALSRRIAELAGGVEDGRDMPSQCLEAAERALRDVLDAGGAARETALDLLAVDALVTYAFEAAAATPDHIPELAARAMSHLSRLAASA